MSFFSRLTLALLVLLTARPLPVKLALIVPLCTGNVEAVVSRLPDITLPPASTKAPTVLLWPDRSRVPPLTVSG